VSELGSLDRYPMQIREAIVANAHGIHCRPSSLIVKEFMNYAGAVRISNERGESDLSSIMQILAMELRQGDAVRIEVSGENEEAVADRLVDLFETHFDYPPT
jgi:phosphocarrier protein HPr